MDKPKGGRGKTAPYETKQMRVPEPLEPQIQELVSRYRSWIFKLSSREIVGANNPPYLLDKPVDDFKQQLDTEEVKHPDKLVDRFDSIDKQEVVVILKEALKLKANAGGAIKERIRQALQLLE